MKISLSTDLNKALHYYGLRIRPFGIANQPNGHVQYIEPAEVPIQLKQKFSEPDYRFGLVGYRKPLSDRDIDHYSLTDMQSKDSGPLFEKFKQLAQDAKDYDMSFQEFVDDYIKPKGDLYSENPFKDMKTAAMFKILAEHGAGSNARNLEMWYNKLK